MYQIPFVKCSGYTHRKVRRRSNGKLNLLLLTSLMPAMVVEAADLPASCSPMIESEARLNKLAFAFEMTFDGKSMGTNTKDVGDTVQSYRDEAKLGTTFSCTLVRDESMDGKKATLFEVRSTGPKGTSISQVWLDKASGLPVHVKSSMKLNSGGEHTLETRYVFSQ